MFSKKCFFFLSSRVYFGAEFAKYYWKVAKCVNFYHRKYDDKFDGSQSRRKLYPHEKRILAMPLVKVKVNQSTCIAPCMVQTTLKRSGMDHTAFNMQRTPCLPLPRKRSPGGASTECWGEHLIAAHYSFIDHERMKGWVGLVGWPIADGLPT